MMSSMRLYHVPVTVSVQAVKDKVSPEAKVFDAAKAEPNLNLGVPALSHMPTWVIVAVGMLVKFSVPVRAFCPPEAEA